MPSTVPPVDTLDRDVDCVAAIMLLPPDQSVEDKVAQQIALGYYLGRLDARSADLSLVAEAIHRQSSEPAGAPDAKAMRDGCIEGLQQGSTRLRGAISGWSPDAR